MVHRRAARAREALPPERCVTPQGASLVGPGRRPLSPSPWGTVDAWACWLACTRERGPHGRARGRKRRRRREHVPPGPSLSSVKRSGALGALVQLSPKPWSQGRHLAPRRTLCGGEKAPLGIAKCACDEQTCSETLILKGGPGAAVGGPCVSPGAVPLIASSGTKSPIT